MPVVGAAVTAIASGIGAAGSAALVAGGSALGGIAAAGGSVLAAGGSALGGLATAGTAAVSGITGLFSPGYGVAGGLIGPATKPIGYGIAELAGKVLPVVQAGRQVYGMFQKPEAQPTTVQPTTAAPQPTRAVPTSILPTLPNLIRPAPAPQIITTPPMTGAQPDPFVKYAPLIGLAVIGYFVLRKK